MFLMKLVKKNENSNLEIEFNIEIDTSLYKEGEHFCLYLDIAIILNEDKHIFNKILIDTCSIEALIKSLDEFVFNEELEYLYYAPLEDNFWIEIPKPLRSKNEIRENFLESGMPKEEIDEMLSHYTHKMFFGVDEGIYFRDQISESGKCYFAFVTKEELKSFVAELKFKYNQLIGEILV
jgi:hypothetical protein